MGFLRVSMSPAFGATFTDAMDAHLVRLAARHRLKLATFDAALRARSWAKDIAEDPT